MSSIFQARFHFSSFFLSAEQLLPLKRSHSIPIDVLGIYWKILL